MTTLLTVLACLLPTAFYVAVIYWADRYEKEPAWLLAATFIWGAIPSIILAVILLTVFSVPLTAIVGDQWSDIISATIGAPVVEESVKGLALFGILVWRRIDIDTWLDGIIYGAVVGMGFAMVENYFYFSSEFASGGYEALGTNIYFRAVVYGLNHALFSSMVGLGIAMGALSKQGAVRFFAPIMGWAIAVSLHAIHNIAATLGGSFLAIGTIVDWLGVWITIVIIIWALRQERRWIRRYLREEVAFGTLTARQYALVSSRSKRNPYLWKMLTQHGFGRYRRTRHFYHQCSKLAYKKHHATIHPEDIAQVNEMRLYVVRLAQQKK